MASSQGGKDVIDCGSSEGNTSEATVEIKIRTLDSQTYTMRVDKCVSTIFFICNRFRSEIFSVKLSLLYTANLNLILLQVPVPALKEQIAIVTGVLSDQQRLICRGKVLKDDQLLSAYRILLVLSNMINIYMKKIKICS